MDHADIASSDNWFRAQLAVRGRVVNYDDDTTQLARML